MFKLSQITTAHAKVKSGADFPAYIQELKQLGVKKYDAYVADGHTIYCGDDESIQSSAKYAVLDIAQPSDLEQFTGLLKLHQQGGSDYLTFCNDCAKTGVEKRTIDLDAMTCSYYNIAGELMLVETIPG